MIPFDEVRSLFPGAEDHVYLNASVTGLLSTRVREAIDGYLERKVAGTASKVDMHATVERARSRFARLIGGVPDEIAIVKNVSEGLNLLAASLPWQAGDNVIICQDLEHPNNIYLWYNLQRRCGIEVRSIEPDDGRVPVERMVAAIDERTRVVTTSHLTFSPGFITDVATLARAARASGALTVIDAAQSVGAIRTDVHEMGVDALAAATQKALLSLYGFGFLWVRKELADSLVPVHVARYGIDLGEDAHETAFSESGRLTYQPGARRFDLGNYSYLGATAADAALALIEEIGMERVETHTRTLAARLARGLLDLGLPVAGGPPGPHLAHIVAVGESGGGRHDSADDPAMNDLYEHLTANGVVFSIRRGVLRFSVAAYNSEADIDRVVDLAREWVQRR